jgi:hypothetical protein
MQCEAKRLASSVKKETSVYRSEQVTVHALS